MQSVAELSTVLGAVQLEWTALSERTGKPVYATKSQKIFHQLHDVYPDQVRRRIVLTCARVRMTASACRQGRLQSVGHMLSWTPQGGVGHIATSPAIEVVHWTCSFVCRG
jgi:hypothetical protein